MNLSIFDIPHLRDEVTRYLSKREQADCIVVCKSWYGYFTPALWRYPLENHKFHHRDIENLVRHKDHIQTIRDSGLRGKRAKSSILRYAFPILRLLEITISSTTQLHYERSVLRFIATTPTLRVLNLRLAGYGDRFHEKFVGILGSHPNLLNLRFGSYEQMRSVQVQEIVQACSKFTSLELNFTLERGRVFLDDVVELEDALAAKGQFTQMKDTNIRDLAIFPSGTGKHQLIIAPLIERCPLLEKLTLEGLTDETILDITAVLKSGRCYLLKEVVSSRMLSGCNRKYMEDLLCSIGFATNITTSSGRNGGGGLEAYTQRISGLWSAALIPRYSQTLARLVLAGNALYGLKSMIAIVYGLPRLQMLTIRISLSSVPEKDLDWTGLLQNRWACADDMIDLALKIDVPHTFKSVLDPMWKGSVVDQTFEWLFSRIGQLRMLRYLKLDCERDLLSLRNEPKYLGKMTELKQLRELLFYSESPGLVSAEEAEWMIENWPRLINVVISENLFGRDKALNRSLSIINLPSQSGFKRSPRPVRNSPASKPRARFLNPEQLVTLRSHEMDLERVLAANNQLVRMNDTKS
ncbi:hypothetical protein BGZ80_010888 [Entomortierella chlamydospora]|uniref:F-box domain-containing protein n=1 Tax=Entomortierella chlamydospora TaxID=101097 RepID=A0A9P6SZJ4_9FUNG|nr:hypothetical protein BGZ80_010888 [Entomortierella chlamydospora]